MTEIEIRHAQKGDPTLDQVTELFVKMYEEMDEMGLLLPLADGGELAWRRGVEASLGRVGALVLAVDAGVVCGFAQGTIKLTPAYLGSRKVGLVGHIYVRPERRRSQLACRMYTALEAWFQERSVSSLELQVLCGNTGGQEMWQRMGFRPELLQMRKQLH